jgi:hypothetical protein
VLATAIHAKVPLDARLPLGEANGAVARWEVTIVQKKLTETLVDEYLDREIRMVLPAVIAVVHHAGSLVGDPDVVVDRVFAVDPGRTMALARAEAARWRGDAAAAATWQTRAAAIQTLMIDDRSVGLAAIAGVW